MPHSRLTRGGNNFRLVPCVDDSPIGKGFFENDARLGRCCHVSGLLMRRFPWAAGHNALREITPIWHLNAGCGSRPQHQ